MTHKELLTEIVETWDLITLNKYLGELRARRDDLDTWIRHVQTLHKKKIAKEKKPVETGARDGR